MIDGNLYVSLDEIDSGTDPTDTAFYAEARFNAADLGALRDLWEQTRQTVAAARKLEAAIGELFGKMLGEDSYRISDTVYTNSASGSRKCKDPDGFWEWVGTLKEMSDVAAMVNLSGVRITAVRAVAEKHGYEARKIEDAFFEWVPKEDADPKVSATPVFKAAKWQQSLKEGEHRGRR
jgi:hypothetical protein